MQEWAKELDERHFGTTTTGYEYTLKSSLVVSVVSIQVSFNHGSGIFNISINCQNQDISNHILSLFSYLNAFRDFQNEVKVRIITKSDPTFLKKIESVFTALKTLTPTIPELHDVYQDILFTFKFDERARLVEEQIKSQIYDEALKTLLDLQKDGNTKPIWDYCEMFYKHLVNQEPLPNGYQIGHMNLTTLSHWYQEIDEASPYYRKANYQLYHLLLTSVDKKLEQTDKENLFRFANRSGEQQLIDYSYNFLCGSSSEKFKNVKGEEDFLLTTAKYIASLVFDNKQLTKKLSEANEQLEQTKTSSSSSQPYKGPGFYQQ